MCLFSDNEKVSWYILVMFHIFVCLPIKLQCIISEKTEIHSNVATD